MGTQRSERALTACVTTCGDIPWSLIKSALPAPRILKAITLCDYDCTPSSMYSVIYYIAASGYLSFMRGELTFCKRRLLYLRQGGWTGRDENNQPKCPLLSLLILTQVHVLRSGPLRERQVLIKGLYDFFLHLADCVRVHDPDRQRVHAAALERNVDVLKNKQKNI